MEENKDNAGDDNDDLDIKYQYWLNYELSDFNDNDNTEATIKKCWRIKMYYLVFCKIDSQ